MHAAKIFYYRYFTVHVTCQLRSLRVQVHYTYNKCYLMVVLLYSCQLTIVNPQEEQTDEQHDTHDS